MSHTPDSKLDDTYSTKEISTVDVTPVESAPSSSLGHIPKRRFSPKRIAKSLTSKQAWLGDYDYAALFTPHIPFLCKSGELPFYGVEDELPHLLTFILGLQQYVTLQTGS